MYSLGVRREFTARHYLIGDDWGEENKEHSHHYRIELVLEADALDRHGFLVDIVEVERHLDEVASEYKGKTLNALPAFIGINPSIERLATVLHDAFRERLAPIALRSIKVIVWEDEIAWTSFRSDL